MVEITSKSLREFARSLYNQGLVPPFFICLAQDDMALHELVGYVSAAEYGSHVEKYPSFGHYDLGAFEEFRFVLPNRRKNNGTTNGDRRR
jgi:hypothetical protein